MTSTPQSYAEKLRSTSSIDIHTPPPDHPSNKGVSNPPPAPPPPPQVYSPHKVQPEFPGKRIWSDIRYGIRISNLGSSISTGVAMSLFLVTWLRSKDQEGVWPENPHTVPVFYLLAAFAVSIPLHFFLLIKHFTTRPQNLTEAYSSFDRICVAIQLFLALTWLVGGVLVRAYGQKRNDFWEWSCHIPRPDSAEVGVKEWMVEWTTVCRWLRVGIIVTYVNAGLEYLSVLTYSIHQCMARRSGYKPVKDCA